MGWLKKANINDGVTTFVTPVESVALKKANKRDALSGAVLKRALVNVSQGSLQEELLLSPKRVRW